MNKKINLNLIRYISVAFLGVVIVLTSVILVHLGHFLWGFIYMVLAVMLEIWAELIHIVGILKEKSK